MFSFHSPSFSILVTEVVLMCVCVVQIMETTLTPPTFRPPTLTSIQCSDVSISEDCTHASFTLSWLTFASDLDPIEHVNIYTSLIVTDNSIGRGTKMEAGAPEDIKIKPLTTTYKFWGRAFSNYYRVANFYLLQGRTPGESTAGTGGQDVKYAFRLQPVTITRTKPALKDCPRIVITY